MAERSIPTVNVAALEIDRALLNLDPQETPAPPPPLPALDAQLSQLQALLATFTSQGVLQQRPDGSFRVAGAPTSVARLATGSDCRCPQCTSYNQLHWVCIGCGTTYAHFGSVKPIPWAGETQLGEGGRAGLAFRVCSQACLRETRQALQQTRPQPGSIDEIPVAGGDVYEGLGL
jgi:hypothetical protein